MGVKANTEKTMATMQVERENKVLDMKAKNQNEVACINNEICQLEVKTKAETEKDVGTQEAETDAYNKCRRAAAKKDVADKAAEGKRAVAEAEGDAATAFQAKREMESELSRLQILENLAENPQVRIITSGERTFGLIPNSSKVAEVAFVALDALRTKLTEISCQSEKNTSALTQLEG